MYRDETPQQREERVRWLQMGVQNGLYRPTGEDVAESMWERLHTFQQNLFLSEGEQPLPETLEPPSLIAEREAQERADLTELERERLLRACYTVSAWEWFVIGFVLTAIAFLVYRNWPGIREWEGWR